MEDVTVPTKAGTACPIRAVSVPDSACCKQCARSRAPRTSEREEPDALDRLQRCEPGRQRPVDRCPERLASARARCLVARRCASRCSVALAGHAVSAACAPAPSVSPDSTQFRPGADKLGPARRLEDTEQAQQRRVRSRDGREKRGGWRGGGGGEGQRETTRWGGVG
eukprot:3504431-Rhodomonas_salina.5